MASEGWDIGDVWRMKAYFTVGETTVLGQPTAVSIYIQSPGSTAPTEYTYGGATVSYSTDGYYYRDTPLTEAGIWQGRAKGTGAIVSAGPTFIEVREANLST